ncbi:Transcriptional regulator, AcrR-family [Leptospira biflexa serovar Patoc strain 'Patoc 1 (Ames)']|uniref:Putative transcriptional regulator, TetR family n=1 Tax=Leptospira biflexa serovar Patoc (strain Patoc 1 / ATCC 23582 / Paris) TaxID=456481 RepID=B0SR93_LEPBP|nr:TetR/AcrR family transcriptional regulator [Leptospira biflexa]ABZ95674.1 Transcriptional regulator, AcrR-family [Leptospira biflexa serovar Patoc strain 'Patoc 1 (Ames)']ABZ99385.1 Putative transcriptional regulator, TetR family [Leptospira biflexa serovar Patoc strain 'Patoc 1 (Paris)']
MPRTGLTASEIQDRAVEIAIDQIREKGFEKVRLVDVAKGMGISHAALYSHFQDKTALLDAVSERWLVKLDEQQESLVVEKRDPIQKILTWFLNLHRMKLEKVKLDPELFKAFDMAAEESKPFIQTHLSNMRKQMSSLVVEAINQKKIKKRDVNLITEILISAGTAFTHPKLVAQYSAENREPLLLETIEIVLKGLS